MPRFHYVAKVTPTEMIQDTLEAEDRGSALAQLASLGYMPLKVTVAKEQGNEAAMPLKADGKIPLRQMRIFIHQFASLIRSQIPIVRALQILVDQTQHKRLRRIIEAMTNEIQREGQSLSQAMRMFPKTFSESMISLVHAGETGGMLEKILSRLDTKLAREEELHNKLRGALMYPLFVGCVGVLTVVVLITFVLPKILGVLERFDVALPLATRILMQVTAWMTNGWFWGILTVSACALFLGGKQVVVMQRRHIDHVILRIPVLGKLIRHLEVAKFCRSLGLLLENGVLILHALEASIAVVSNARLRETLDHLPANIADGGALSTSLKDLRYSEPFLVNTVAIGEEGGKLGEALLEVARYYESEAERHMQILAGLLEPIMILGVGAFVGFIVMAVLLPIFEMGSMAR